MVSQIESPDKILGMRISGKITAEDFDWINPFMEKYNKDYGEIFLYMEVEDYKYASAEAFWEDIKTGFRFMSNCTKIAIATDEKWIGKISSFLSKITPIEIEVFHLNDRGKAFAWLQ